MPNKKDKRSRRPESVPLSLEMEIKAYVAKSWPSVVEPELADQVSKKGGKSKNLIRVPSELFFRHAQNLRSIGTSEAEIEQAVSYLLAVFEEAARQALGLEPPEK